MPRVSEILNGRSPRERAFEKQRRVLQWLYVWGFSATEEIRRVSGQEARGYALRLSRAGILVASRTEAGGVMHGVPKQYYTLSALGLAEVERHATNLFRYPELDPHKVNQRLLRHNLLAQRLTLDAMRDGHIVAFQTERQWATEPARPRYKRRDVLWKDTAGNVIGVEVELTGKWDRDLDEFVDGVVMELVMSGVHARTLQKFLIATDSKALANRYRQALEPGAKYRTWGKDQHGRWKQKEESEVPDLIEGLVEVRLLGEE
jgi:DNA-binding PadR family transcriptional regulator